jgi:hypothetical protein
MMNQKDAVFTATMSVLSDKGLELNGDIKSHPELKAIRSAVHAIVTEGFRTGSIKLESEFDDAGLKSYVSGLINNWYRKDKRLNGGEQYKAKNPGSRAHVGNPEVRELRKLRAAQEAAGADETVLAAIDEAIETKLAEAKQAKAPEVDLTKIDPELLAKIGLA